MRLSRYESGKIRKNPFKLGSFQYGVNFFHEKWDCFRWAFENLPERPPNLIQFKKLLMECPKLRTETQVYLPPPDVPPMPDEIRKKINELRKSLTSHKYQR